MKGPSLEAIRKFKQQQEQKKRDDFDRQIEGKLTTLKHRAAQGDKKAKQQLKIIERSDEERSKQAEPEKNHHVTRQRGSFNGQSSSKSIGDCKPKSGASKPKQLETDFEELMRLAVNNKNEIKHEEVKETRTSERKKIPRHQPKVQIVNRGVPLTGSSPAAAQVKNIGQTSQPKSRQIPPSLQPKSRQIPPPSLHHQTIPGHARGPQPSVSNLARRPIIAEQVRSNQARPKLPVRIAYRDDDDYDDEADDDYESDGFVVHDEDDEVKDELDKTLRTLFRYDKRRCDLRERELDRQYRAIGRVSTFEDLEREERRASRLAAAEDASALREEEERKRLKKMRLKGSKD